MGSARLKEEFLKNEAIEVPPLDEWRISYLRNLLEQRQMLHCMGDNKGLGVSHHLGGELVYKLT